MDEQKKEFTKDIRKEIYESLNNINLLDIEQLHNDDLSDKPYNYCIVASDKRNNMDDLKKIGNVKTLSMEEILWY